MPSKSKKQAKLMRAVAHGWKPSRMKGPTRAVAKEFVNADKRRDKVTGYQFGGGVPYRGVPPQRGALSAGRQGMQMPWQGRGPNPMGGRPRQPRGRMEGRGYGHAGGVPGTIGGFGGYQGEGRSPFGGRGGGGGGVFGGGSGPFMPPRGSAGMPQGGGMGGALQQYMQQQGGGGLPPGIDPQAVAANPEGWAQHQADPRFAAQQQMESARRGMAPPGGGGQVGLMGEGPGGRLEQEGMRRRAKMQGPGRFPGAGGMAGRMGQAQNRFGALTQGAPGGGSFGKRPPGRGIAPPPNKYPGGGNPNLGGRNPMMRGAGRFGGRGGRGMFR